MPTSSATVFVEYHLPVRSLAITARPTFGLIGGLRACRRSVDWAMARKCSVSMRGYSSRSLFKTEAASTVTDRICFPVTQYAAMIVTGQHNISVTELE